MAGLRPGDQDRVAAETAKILASQIFERSPVLSRLLSYLVDMTAAGTSPSSVQVAVEGLGRNPDDSLECSNYARAAVGRLRREIARYYSTLSQDEEIYIEPETYLVRLRTGAKPSGLAASRGPARGQRPVRRLSLLAAGLFVVLAAGIGLLTFSASKDKKVWQSRNFPRVSVAETNPGPGGACYNAMISALGGYAGISLVEHNVPADYQVRILPVVQRQEQGHLFQLIHLARNRILWSRSLVGENACGDEERVSALAHAIASPSGLIEARERITADPHTPYGCWLQFTRGIKTFNTASNNDLRECASNWFAADSEDPVAALLFSWTLMDRASLELSDSGRTRLLRQALAILNEAALLNSDFALLQIARMRVLTLLARHEPAVAAARKALELGGDNPIITGMAGAGLAMWNDPEGERILLARSGDRLPWEHTGLFFVAMMRDDPQAASAQLAQLEEYDGGQPVLQIFRAAYLSRIGKKAEAEAVIAGLERDPRIWLAGRDRIMERLPIGPEAKKQLKRWLSATADAEKRAPGPVPT